MPTSYIPVIPELKLLGVFEPGVPNRERIVLKVEAKLDIGLYAIVLAKRAQPTGHAAPLRDSMYWIGSGTVEQNDWFFVFTGSGQPQIIPPESGNGKLFIEYWGRPHTIFHDAQIVPVLWRTNGITVERVEPDLARLA